MLFSYLEIGENTNYVILFLFRRYFNLEISYKGEKMFDHLIDRAINSHKIIRKQDRHVKCLTFKHITCFSIFTLSLHLNSVEI